MALGTSNLSLVCAIAFWTAAIYIGLVPCNSEQEPTDNTTLNGNIGNRLISPTTRYITVQDRLNIAIDKLYKKRNRQGRSVTDHDITKAIRKAQKEASR